MSDIALKLRRIAATGDPPKCLARQCCFADVCNYPLGSELNVCVKITIPGSLP
jgi:hypothetical protein